MSEFTPGPWHDDGYRIYAPTEAEDKRNGRVIVEYKHMDDFNDADARLIAAAPEMFAALREIADWNSTHNTSSDWTNVIVRLAQACLENMRTSDR